MTKSESPIDAAKPKTIQVPLERNTSNNWNPFSSQPALSFEAFVVTLIAIGTFEIVTALFIHQPIHAARLALDLKQMIFLYLAWSLISLLGFFFVATAFAKRWATIYELLECPRWMKGLARFFLISPLLSLWATLFTISFARNGWLFRDGDRRWVILYRAVMTLFVFHLSFLGWRLVRHEISYKGGVFHLVQEVSMKDSVQTTLPGLRVDGWVPNEAFHVHLYPYLSPLMKLGVSIYGDFTRIKAMADAVENQPEEYCSDTPKYLGEKVADCFMSRYRQLAAQRAFVTPALGVIYESVYRRKNTQAPTTAMASVAINTVGIENMIALLEPSELVYDRSQFTQPIGLLAVYGSPELPMIAIGQDFQHELLAKKFVPLLMNQIAVLNKNIGEAKPSFTPGEEQATLEKVSSLEQRLKALQMDPLSIQKPPLPSQ